MALRANSWICCPELPYHPSKNGTHSTCFCSTGGHIPILPQVWMAGGSEKRSIQSGIPLLGRLFLAVYATDFATKAVFPNFWFAHCHSKPGCERNVHLLLFVCSIILKTLEPLMGMGMDAMKTQKGLSLYVSLRVSAGVFELWSSS